MLADLAPVGVSPDAAVAIDDAGRTLNYGDLPTLQTEWADRLSGRRLVVLLCENTVPSLSAYVGLQAAGHVVILLSAKIDPGTLADLVEHYGVEAVVRGDDLQGLRDSRGGLHEALSVCLSTSGSTGSPKLVRFTGAQLVANARSIVDYLELGPDERPLAHLPFEYSFGLSVVHSHMAAGATLLLTEHSVMQKPFWTRLAEATSLSGVPFHFEMLLRMRLGRADLPKLRTLTQAGGRLGPREGEAILALAREKGWRFHIMYGQTEAGPRIAWLPFEELEGHLDCIGRPIPGVRLDVSDGGELVVQSPGIMMGYAESRQDLARGNEMQGVLYTGDLVERLGDIYRITGRKSRFVKLQGNRVSLADVEARLSARGHGVACVGRDDLLAIFTENPDIETLRQDAVALFSFPPRSMQVRHVERFPRRENQKIDYAALQKVMEAP